MEEEARLGGSEECSGHEPAGADRVPAAASVFPAGQEGGGAFREDRALGWRRAHQ